MKLSDDIKQFYSNATVDTDPKVDERILQKVVAVHKNLKPVDSIANQPIIWSLIMKSPHAKIAIAAIIIVAVVLGLFEFIGGNNGSGVVWAEVARKVQASGSLILRISETGTMAFGDDYGMKYFSSAGSRTDSYKNGQVIQSRCFNAATKTTTVIHYGDKRYYSYQLGEGIDGLLEKDEDWTNPKYLVEKILSVAHTELGEKTVNGILCEGLETSDPAVMGDEVKKLANSLNVHIELWVDVQTQYPVRFESRVAAEAEGQAFESNCVMDQFLWNADIAPSQFELEIPDGFYQQM